MSFWAKVGIEEERRRSGPTNRERRRVFERRMSAARCETEGKSMGIILI